MRYAPRGVAAVIAPWNFPLAIPAGMTSAALAAGNAVVLKPAEQSPASAGALVEALHGAGVPADALALLPGYGDAGDCSAGFSTTPLPAASPAATIPVGIASGKFHGAITAQTPRAT